MDGMKPALIRAGDTMKKESSAPEIRFGRSVLSRSTQGALRSLPYLLALIQIAPAQQAQQPVFRAETGLVQVYASITDESGQPLRNLSTSSVRVLENGVPQQVRFVGQEDIPVAATLLVDGNARPEPVKAVSSVLAASLKSNQPLLVARFDAEPEPAPAGPSRDRDDIRILPLRPRTALRDALSILINRMEPNGAEVKRALIIVAEAATYRSPRSRGPILEAAQEKGVSIYAIRLEPPDTSRTGGNRALRALRGALVWTIDLFDDLQSPEETQKELERLTDGSGGDTCAAASTEAAEACARSFAEEIKSQYVIAYRPTTLARAGRKVEISIEGHPKAVVRIRKAYGANGEAGGGATQP
jgi:VWFA-related protein